MSKLPEVTAPQIDWQVMFWKLATLIGMGWYDEAIHFIGTVSLTPVVVMNEPEKKD